jgi:hypothetical protein
MVKEVFLPRYAMLNVMPSLPVTDDAAHLASHIESEQSMNMIGHDEKERRPPNVSSRIFKCRGEKFGSEVFVGQIPEVIWRCSNPYVKDSTFGIHPSGEFMVQTLRKGSVGHHSRTSQFVVKKNKRHDKKVLGESGAPRTLCLTDQF